MGERNDQATTRGAVAGGLTGDHPVDVTTPATVADAKEAAAEAVELVKEKLGAAVRSER
jgi:hypothetical protein